MPPHQRHTAPKTLAIVTPALADANNGNWQTARRWQQLLQPLVHTRVLSAWPDGAAAGHDVALLALHARKSFDSVAAWVQARGTAGLGVVLTGTDLYRDIHTSAQAQQALEWAQRLVVLQERGLDELPVQVRRRAVVIFQSTSTRQTLVKSQQRLRALMVGHLRDEKSPQTLWAAARLLRQDEGILIDHVGEPLDATLGVQAQLAHAQLAHYRWLGGLPHEAVRRRIQRSHVLVHASRMEGGAHVVMEAVQSGTPVLASRIPGNVGMLGEDYAGYFDWDDAHGLAQLLRQCRAQGPHGLLHSLQIQSAARAPLFARAAEQAALHNLVHELMGH